MIPNVEGTLLWGILSLATLWWSWKKRLFSLPEQKAPLAIRWFHPTAVFSIYFFIAIFIAPFLGQFLQKKILSPTPITVSCWVVFLTSLLILTSFLIYYFSLPKAISRPIWRSSNDNSFQKDLLCALLYCAIAFPLILFLGSFFELLIYFLFSLKEIPDQIAVLFLKMTLGYPLYFAITLMTVVILAPCIEEILFRGFLQSFLRQHFGARSSIGISSLCFAFFHYAPEQGVANIAIIGSLFGLALFLGFVYEKRGSLLTSIILHASFNMISVVNLYFYEA